MEEDARTVTAVTRVLPPVAAPPPFEPEDPASPDVVARQKRSALLVLATGWWLAPVNWLMEPGLVLAVAFPVWCALATALGTVMNVEMAYRTLALGRGRWARAVWVLVYTLCAVVGAGCVVFFLEEAARRLGVAP